MDVPPEVFFLLTLSVAAGIDLYLTLLVLGVAGFLGTGDGGGVALTSFIGLPVLLGLGCLYLTEALAELRPSLAVLWHSLQFILRPLGAMLLGMFFLEAEGLPVVLLGIAMAGVVALFSHLLVWGQGLIFRLVPGRSPPLLLLNLSSDLWAVALLTMAMTLPELGALGAILFLAAGTIFGGARLGAFRFGLALSADRVWGIVSPAEWRPQDELPRWVRNAAASVPLEGVKGARAATWGVLGFSKFREGWILRRNERLFFVPRQGREPRILPFDEAPKEVRVGPFAKTLLFRSSDGDLSALFLQMGLNAPESHK
jgi:hypothetical protein